MMMMMTMIRLMNGDNGEVYHIVDNALHCIAMVMITMVMLTTMVTMLIILWKSGGLVFRAESVPLDDNVVHDDVDDND